MRTYLASIGHHSSRVTRPILSNGIDPGDQVVLARPVEGEEDSRATEAITDVRQLIGEVQPDATVDVERVPIDAFDTTVLACSDLLRAASGTVFVNFAGGPREVLVPFVVATVAHFGLVDETFLISDVENTVRSIELPPVSVATISPPERETLAMIASQGDETTVPEVTDASERSKSTVTRHVTALENAGFVESWREGKTKHLRLTLGGELQTRRDS